MDFAGYTIDTPELSLKGIQTLARVVSVYDGDTMTLVIPFKGDCYKFNCRLAGIDTCEIKSKVQKNKDTAVQARNRLLQLMGLDVKELNAAYTRSQIQKMLSDTVTLVNIDCYDFDKYGRVLVDVYDKTRTTNIVRCLLEEKLAYKYDGTTKLTEDQQFELL